MEQYDPHPTIRHVWWKSNAPCDASPQEAISSNIYHVLLEGRASPIAITSLLVDFLFGFGEPGLIDLCTKLDKSARAQCVSSAAQQGSSWIAIRAGEENWLMRRDTARKVRSAAFRSSKNHKNPDDAWDAFCKISQQWFVPQHVARYIFHEASNSVRWMEFLEAKNKALERRLQKYNDIVNQLRTQDLKEESEGENSLMRRRHRRGRKPGSGGQHKLVCDDDCSPEFWIRDVVFNGSGRASTTCSAQMDTFCQLPNPVLSLDSAHCMGRFKDIDRAFKDPNCFGIGGNKISLLGVLRNVQFRIKGSSLSLRRDVYVSEALNNVADMILNANFIQKHMSLLFMKMKSFFGGWFAKKKESKADKADAEAQRKKADLIAAELERKRREKELISAQSAINTTAHYSS